MQIETAFNEINRIDLPQKIEEPPTTTKIAEPGERDFG